MDRARDNRARAAGRGRRAAAWVAACALAGGGLAGGALVSASPALAAAGDPVCSGGTCSVTFATPGTGQSFTVPAGVSSLSVALYGAIGGGFTDQGILFPGGDGAEVTAALAVNAGEQVGVDVGGAGGFQAAGDGGINGGGSSDIADGGGGATDITADGTRLLVAGGGGGAGADAESSGAGIAGCPSLFADGGAGGNADTAGGAGEAFTNGTFSLGGGQGGLPGTQTGPGAGGQGGTVTGTDPCSADSAPGPGTEGAGGTGATGGSSFLTGGGGGGYYGGGAGGEAASAGLYSGGTGGGGGGSSYDGGSGVTGPQINDEGNPFTGSGQVNSGNGEAVLSWADAVSAGAPSFTATAGQTLSVTQPDGLLSTATDAIAGDTLTASTASSPEATAQGGSVAVNSDGSFTYTPPSATFTGTDTFTYTVTDAATGEYATGTATVNVQAAAVPDKADVQAGLSCPAGLTVGESGTCTLTVTNAGPAVAASAAAGAVVTGPLKVTGCSGGCSDLLGLLGWSLGSLPAGQSVTLTIDVTATRAGTAAIAAADASLTPDPDLLNNIAGATVKVTKS